MKAVVVEIYAVINSDGVEKDALALENACAMVSASRQKNISDRKILASIENH